MFHVEWLKHEKNYGQLYIEPLERGYGHTVGNALRRVLLSSIEGCAPIGVRIDGVLHEFSTIPGVKEDVVDILLNLKGLVVRLHNSELKTISIEKRGPKIITAEDFIPDSDVEIINPDLYIATLDNEDSVLRMDVVIQRGKGYVSADKLKGTFTSVGYIPMDAFFSPVKQVSYKVENTRVGQITDFERVVLDIWTNGAITPAESLLSASRILKDSYDNLTRLLESELQHLIFREDLAAHIPEETPVEISPVTQESGTPIESLGLSLRIVNLLKRGGIHTVESLIEKTPKEIKSIKNIGDKMLLEIEEKLRNAGYILKQEEGVK
ncbi:MAG TPA: DNA-directed RNA polymerase subunit alpha [bacterium]|jgi:DNA-directed RNA polymerase subunit alpha|nr:DNA-directed RNA polymerase subunit alpha [Dictyoglomota bacterium]HHV81004.1 DNA-directed RNA polymerase subunit alpha [bacterium]HOK29539.1 DNA-directed RNA polymerase subunit alpha [bacterium]HOL54868.1 DNA-directed RNA polymerase subunit alpha [bacterium]HOP55577.1 DNA-directed RNA polymerase subunit alpha [bacterium]